MPTHKLPVLATSQVSLRARHLPSCVRRPNSDPIRHRTRVVDEQSEPGTSDGPEGRMPTRVSKASDYRKLQKTMLKNPELAAQMAAREAKPLPPPGQAKWKPGQLLPEGFDRMSAQRKVSELYLGQRGLIFWINKSAWGACIAVIAGWFLFRFIGPALGLYELKEGFNSTPNAI